MMKFCNNIRMENNEKKCAFSEREKAILREILIQDMGVECILLTLDRIGKIFITFKYSNM
jgi:hypothetical protein